MAEYLDPIWLDGRIYVRTGRGYHVPVETMTAQQLFEAWADWDLRLMIEAELVKGLA